MPCAAAHLYIRSVQDWRAIIRGCTGFVDTMLYEMEAGDPTWDEMLCFVKPPFKPAQAAQMSQADIEADSTCPPLNVLPEVVDVVLDQLPTGLMAFMQSAVAALESGLPELQTVITGDGIHSMFWRLMIRCTGLVGTLSGAQRDHAMQMLPKFFEPLQG